MRKPNAALTSRPAAMLAVWAWMALLGAILSPATADDASEIRSLIGATWGKPGSKVETDPVVIAGHYAVASWTQGEHGGRALLRRGDTGWSVVLCSGDPLRDAGWLVEAGVPQTDAQRIAADLATAEAQLPAKRREMFSLFEGVVSGNSDAHRGPSDHDHPHSHP